MSRKWLILAVMLGFIALGLSLSNSQRVTYTAETVLLLEDNNASLTNAVDRDNAVYDNSDAAIEVFGSRHLIEDVVTRLNLLESPEFNPHLSAKSPESETPSLLSRLFGGSEEEDTIKLTPDEIFEETVDRVQSQVLFIGNPKNTLIRIRATSSSPAGAAKLSSAVADAFLDDVLSSRLSAVDRVVDQLGIRVDELRGNVQSSKQALQDFLKTAETSDEISLQFMRDEANRLRARIQEMHNELELAKSDLEEVKALSSLSNNATRRAITASPALRALKLAVENELGLPPSQSSVPANLERVAEDRVEKAQRRLDTLRLTLTNLEQRSAIQNQNRLRLEQLEAEEKASTEIYEFSVRRLNELSVQAGLDAGGGRVILDASPPREADGRGVVRNVFVFAILGLTTAIGVVLIAEVTNQRIRSVNDLAAIMPQARIVSIPKVPRKGMLGRGGVSWDRVTQVGGSPFGSSIQKLRTRLLEGSAANEATVVHMTSDLISFGKSVATLALAQSLVSIGKNVLVINADGPQSHYGPLLDLPQPQTGLETLLLEGGDLDSSVIKERTYGFDLLLNTASNHHSADLLEGENFVALLQRAKQIYDVVLVDTAPALTAPDASQVARHSNQTVFLAGNNASTTETVQAGLSEIGTRSLKSGDVISLYGADLGPEIAAQRKMNKYARI